MAMFEKQDINGIQLGNFDDFCLECKRTDKIPETQQDFEGKEIFKIRIHGLNHCLCMKHLKSYLKGYKLVRNDKNNDDNDTITISKSFLRDSTTEEVISYIEKELL